MHLHPMLHQLYLFIISTIQGATFLFKYWYQYAICFQSSGSSSSFHTLFSSTINQSIPSSPIASNISLADSVEPPAFPRSFFSVLSPPLLYPSPSMDLQFHHIAVVFLSCILYSIAISLRKKPSNYHLLYMRPHNLKLDTVHGFTAHLFINETVRYPFSSNTRVKYSTRNSNFIKCSFAAPRERHAPPTSANQKRMHTVYLKQCYLTKNLKTSV